MWTIPVLLLIVVGELLFYFNITNKVTVPSGPVITPSLEPLEIRDTLPTGSTAPPFLYEPDILEEIRRRTIDEERKVSIQINNIGTVNEVTQNYSDSYNRSADLYLDILHNKGVAHSKYFLNKNNIKIYIVSKDGQKKEASIPDIKQDDKIEVKEIVNVIDFNTKEYIYSYTIEIAQ